jgi:hypothetical protein
MRRFSKKPYFCKIIRQNEALQIGTAGFVLFDCANTEDNFQPSKYFDESFQRYGKYFR